MLDNPPRSPADPRPGDEPYFIDPVCDTCGVALVPDAEAVDKGWFDEFVCDCPGVHMDWPDSEFARLAERARSVEDGNWVHIDDLER
jgi:hypothetical protein